MWRRKWFKVPEGPWPCEVCSEYLVTGTWAHRRVVQGEAFYRHPTVPSCSAGAPGPAVWRLSVTGLRPDPQRMQTYIDLVYGSAHGYSVVGFGVPVLRDGKYATRPSGRCRTGCPRTAHS